MMVGESNQNVLLIQIDASRFADFEISEFELARVDCISSYTACMSLPQQDNLSTNAAN